MSSPAVSVLVPCFRSARFVRRALDSLLAQRFTAWEAVSIDNASDDETYDIISSYSSRDARFRVGRNPTNVGPLANWSRCAEDARAERAGLLFADDWYGDRFLELALPYLEDSNVGFVLVAATVVRGGANGVPKEEGARTFAPFSRGGVYPTRVFLEDVYYLRQRMPVTPGCALMRTRDLARWLKTDLPDRTGVGFARHGAGPDLHLYLQACVEYPSFGYVADPQVFLLSHESNLSKTSGARSGYAMALKEFFESHRLAQLSEARVQAGLWWRLRKDHLRRPSIRSLGLRGLFHAAAIALKRAVAVRGARG